MSCWWYSPYIILKVNMKFTYPKPKKTIFLGFLIYSFYMFLQTVPLHRSGFWARGRGLEIRENPPPEF